MDNVILQSGTRVDLAQLDFIKKGGVGSVFKLSPDKVIKIFHDYDQQRISKLQAFVAFLDKVRRAGKLFPTEVVRPIELAYDGRKRVVGFTMDLMPRGFEKMTQLCLNVFRQQFRITPVTVARIFLAGVPIVEGIHQTGAAIGDFNHRNVFFKLGSPPLWRIIDCDSFVFEKFASGEGDALFLPPELYGINLSNPVYKSQHDWYSFAVMFFMGLTMSHPFGGGYKNLRTIEQRTKAGISVFSRDVVYPKSAIPLAEAITPNLKSVFLRYFEGKDRSPFPLAMIQGYIDEKEGRVLVVIAVPIPVARPVTIVPTNYQLSSLSTSKATLLLKTSGSILYSTIIDGQFLAIADENGKAILYQVDIGSSYDKALIKERKELFNLATGARVCLIKGTDHDGNEANYVVVNPAYSPELELWEVGKTVRRIKEDIETNIFLPTGHAIFRTSDTMLYLMISNQLFVYKVVNGELRRTPLRPFRREQTWFAVDPTNEKPRALVFYIAFGDLEFVLLEETSAFPVKLTTLDKDEVMTEVSVRFDKRGILVIRQTEKRKETYFRIDTLNPDGTLRYSSTPVKKDDHFYEQIHGRIYRVSVDQTSGKVIDLVLHPTVGGVRQERLQESRLVDIPTDPDIANEKSSLLAFFLAGRKTAGIIVVNQAEVYRVG